MINTERLLQQFLALVKIDSVSGQEKKLAEYLKDILSGLGFNVNEDDAGEKINYSCGNLIARLPGSRTDLAPLLLSAHMDTVEPGRGVDPVLEDGIVRSRGETILGADDKAGIAIILEAVRVLQEQKIPHGPLEVVLTVGEEQGLLGARHLDYSLLTARWGYVLDCDGQPGTLIVRAPSQDRISATITGRAAHAGINPEDGINAIYVAARAINRMKLGRLDEETTANIGTIAGGKATNIVPETVTIQGEVRSLTDAVRQQVTRQMVDILQSTAAEMGARADVQVETLYHSFHLSPDNPALVLAGRAARTLGLPVVHRSSGGGSDANVFNQHGLAVANLGIAMQKVHTTEEFIAVQDLVQSTAYLVEIIKQAGDITP
ncbi:MAG: M20/M25/M40 family metallo-hydrolase [Bacillota bacterium]|uniref:M20/M25/M40 family metallo-hydrolase n=1 Tax=Desulfurispora thermophila TaxID=265470 RepID=UPI000374C11F|nr:M20/M25/M40 family metallo-hydrolase [Desulfurispora thermophila]